MIINELYKKEMKAILGSHQHKVYLAKKQWRSTIYMVHKNLRQNSPFQYEQKKKKKKSSMLPLHKNCVIK